MHLLVTEDEASAARRLERLLRKILGERIATLHLAPPDHRNYAAQPAC